MGKFRVQIQATDLRVRTGPSTSYKVIAKVNTGETYTSSKQSGGWYYLDEKSGWSSGQSGYIKVLEDLSGGGGTETVPVPGQPGDNTTSANSTDSGSGLDAKVLEMLKNSVAKAEAKIDASMRLFGNPHQFTHTTDFRPTGGNYDLGRKYMEAIMSEAPIVYFMPGRPNFLPNISESQRDAMKDFFGNLQPETKDNRKMLDLILGNKDVRYFDFVADYATYIKYVNLLCRVAATYMDLGEETAPITAFKQKYKWFNWSNYRFEDSFIPEKSKEQSIFDLSTIKDAVIKGMMGNWQHVQFYVDPRTSFQESASNQTAESKLASLIQTGSQTMKEAQFFLQTGAMGGAAQWLADSQGSWQEALTKFGTDGILKRLGDVGTSIISGSNMLFPEIWGNSAYNKSYNITINLTSPYGDRESLYLNIIVPLMHLIALALPRQTTANSFTTPFIVKVSSKGWFNCEMGIIDNISIEKVGGSYSANGIPTEVKVNVGIKDLYSSLMMTSNSSPALFFENKGLMNWLAVTCGMDITKPHFEEKFTAILMTLFNSMADIPADYANKMLEALRNKVDGLFKN